jgi:hypothetical protein
VKINRKTVVVDAGYKGRWKVAASRLKKIDNNESEGNESEGNESEEEKVEEGEESDGSDRNSSSKRLALSDKSEKSYCSDHNSAKFSLDSNSDGVFRCVICAQVCDVSEQHVIEICQHKDNCTKCIEELALRGDLKCPICRAEITNYTITQDPMDWFLLRIATRCIDDFNIFSRQMNLTDEDIAELNRISPIPPLYNEEDLQGKKVLELKELLQNNGLKKSGRKAELIERLTSPIKWEGGYAVLYQPGVAEGVICLYGATYNPKYHFEEKDGKLQVEPV